MLVQESETKINDFYAIRSGVDQDLRTGRLEFIVKLFVSEPGMVVRVPHPWLIYPHSNTPITVIPEVICFQGPLPVSEHTYKRTVNSTFFPETTIYRYAHKAFAKHIVPEIFEEMLRYTGALQVLAETSPYSFTFGEVARLMAGIDPLDLPRIAASESLPVLWRVIAKELLC